MRAHLDVVVAIVGHEVPYEFARPGKDLNLVEDDERYAFSEFRSELCGQVHVF